MEEADFIWIKGKNGADSLGKQQNSHLWKHPEDLGVLALMITTVPFSLTCQDPGKGEEGLEVVRTGQSCREGGQGQALTGLGLELILWLPSQDIASQCCFLSLTIWRSQFPSVADFI